MQNEVLQRAVMPKKQLNIEKGKVACKKEFFHAYSITGWYVSMPVREIVVVRS